MTGEVSSIKADGTDSNGDVWAIHAQVARALRCTLRPFDTYVGPYIQHKRGKVFISSEDGEEGTVCLWVNGIAPAYCDPITENYFPLNDASAALFAAREVLKRARKVSA